ncbi:MAG: hypothetical protein PGN11_12265 [Quadrisphaera sp.]
MASVEPSSTTTTSWRGWRSASMALTEPTTEASSSKAGITTDTDCVSGEALASSTPRKKPRRR